MSFQDVVLEGLGSFIKSGAEFVGKQMKTAGLKLHRGGNYVGEHPYKALGHVAVGTGAGYTAYKGGSYLGDKATKFVKGGIKAASGDNSGSGVRRVGGYVTRLSDL